MEQAQKKRDIKTPVPDRKPSKGDSVLLKDHTSGVWDPRYTGDYWIISFPRRTQFEVVDSKGKAKLLHISDVKYVLPADRVISKLPDYQYFGRQSKLGIDLKEIPNLKWEPDVTINTNFSYVDGCLSFCFYDVITNFLNNRTNTWIWRQAFASLQHGFLRSEENVVLYNFETPQGVWENVVSCNILTLNFYKTII